MNTTRISSPILSGPARSRLRLTSPRPLAAFARPVRSRRLLPIVACQPLPPGSEGQYPQELGPRHSDLLTRALRATPVPEATTGGLVPVSLRRTERPTQLGVSLVKWEVRFTDSYEWPQTHPIVQDIDRANLERLFREHMGAFAGAAPPPGSDQGTVVHETVLVPVRKGMNLFWTIMPPWDLL
jgi:hypothetical protein